MPHTSTNNTRTLVQDALDALYYIPADLDREDWVKVGMAAKAAGLSFDDFDAWSAQASDSYDAAACRHTWRSFKDGKGITERSLFHTAAQHGYRNGGKPVSRPVSRVAKQAKQPSKPAPGMSAAEVWGRCLPATYDHPYIKGKQASGVPLDDLRVLPAGDPLQVMGESMAGALVVPAISLADDSLQSLQLIATPEVAARLKSKGKSGKLNLPGCSIGWAYHVVGELEQGGIAYICEGIGAAWACWQATGRAAVVAFGSGNMEKVAKSLRNRDVTAQLVLVPDTGKEDQAREIAAKVGGMLVTMPDGWPSNSDVADLAHRDGLDALVDMLELEVEKPEVINPLDSHPLAKFVDHADRTPAVKWLIPGLIEHGVVTISGARGVGKTTALLPLAMVAAGLHAKDDPLAPKPGRWRHVVYIVEHVDQAHRIIAGLVRHSNLGISFDDVRERIHLVEALRMHPMEIAEVGKLYSERFTRDVNGVAVRPLVVFDTKAAVFEIENENDNSEGSRAVAAIKQQFEGLPCWIIGHIAKSQFGRDEVKDLSDRGAGSFEADAIQNIYLVEDSKTKQRLMLLGKRRFEARWTELGVESQSAEVIAYDEWGDEERTWLRWGILKPLQQSRAEAREQAEEDAEQERLGNMREAILDTVQIAWQSGHPLSKTGVKDSVRGFQKAAIHTEVGALLAEGWLHEVEVPSGQRINNNKSRFLIRLATPEHDEFKRSGILPTAKLTPPASWRKAEIPSVPDAKAENA